MQHTAHGRQQHTANIRTLSCPTECPDLTDTGVISCICPNSTQTTQLDACHGCISSLTGITDVETNSINTLFNAWVALCLCLDFTR